MCINILDIFLYGGTTLAILATFASCRNTKWSSLALVGVLLMLYSDLVLNTILRIFMLALGTVLFIYGAYNHNTDP